MTPATAETSEKNVWLATALSVILPGAGLGYVGKWTAAALNFAAAVALPLLALLFGSKEIGEHIHYLILAIAAGSGGWAHATAVGHNRSLGDSPLQSGD